MLERLTEDAKTALRLADAHTRGDGTDRLDTGDLLLGLLDEGGAGAEALVESGLSAADAREAVAAQRCGTRPASSAPVTMAPDARAAIQEALRQAVALSQRQLGPAHLLLGAVGADTVATRALAALGVDVESVRRLALAKAAGGNGLAPTGLPPGPTDVPLLPAPPALPDGRATATWYAAVAVVYLVLSVPVAALAAPGDRGAVAVAAVLVPPLAYGLARLLRPLARQRVRQRFAGGAALRLPAAELTEALRGSGVAALEVYRSDARVPRNTAYGMGSHGFIRLARVTLEIPGVAEFVTAHEAGHIARRDTLRLLAATCLVEGLLAGGLLSRRPAGFGLAVLIALGLRTGLRWQAELDSDAIAVRWVGPASALAWYQFQRGVRRVGARPAGRYLRAGLAWLQHPPPALRRRYWSRSPGRPVNR